MSASKIPLVPQSCFVANGSKICDAPPLPPRIRSKILTGKMPEPTEADLRRLSMGSNYDGWMANVTRRFGARAKKIPIDTGRMFAPGAKPMEATYVTNETTTNSATEEAIKKVYPSVVQMRAWGVNSAWSGSGVIVDPKDVFPNEFFPPNVYFVMTNNHVVPADETKFLTVTLSDGTVFKNVRVLESRAKKTGVQDDTVDCGIVMIQSDRPLQTVKVAKEPPRLGETIFTAGHPLGLPKVSFTRGIVSQTAAETGSSVYAIQHDAEINPGNSGGPLFNLNGEVLGLNTYTFTDSNGLSFAMPVHEQLNVMRRIYAEGSFPRGEFNFTVAQFTDYERMMNDFPKDLPAAKVDWVDPGTEIHKLGLRANDLVTRAIDQEGNELEIGVDNPFEVTKFLNWMQSRKIGSVITMVVYKYSKLNGKVTYKPETIDFKATPFTSTRNELESEAWGFRVERAPKAPPIITKISSSSPAFAAGMEAGKWILLGVAAPGVLDEPMAITDLNTFKRVLVMLENQNTQELTIWAADKDNPSKKRKFVLKRNTLDAVMEPTVSQNNTHLYKANAEKGVEAHA